MGRLGRAPRRFALQVIVLCLMLLASSCTPRPKFIISPEDVPPLSAHPALDASPEERVAAHMEFLTSPFCNGREIGTGGAAKSAQYVSDQFERIGLKPAYGRKYVDAYATNKADQASGSIQVFDEAGQPVDSFTSPRDLGIAYYPSYGGRTVRGVLKALPNGRDEWEKLGKDTIVVAQHNENDAGMLIRTAAEFKVAAVLLAIPASAKSPVPVTGKLMAGIMPISLITEESYNLLQSHLGKSAMLQMDAQRGDALTGFNVAGILGDPSSQSTVLFCAHRDSLGRDGDSWVPVQGGTDNASGTAALLEIAHLLRTDPDFKWAAVFLSVDGEEIGLTGSKEFATDYPFSDLNLKLVVNLDCVASAGSNEIEIYATPLKQVATSAAEDIIEHLAAVSLRGTVTEEKYGSDHQSFEAKGVPALSIHSPGTAYRDYLHCPKDTLETVDVSILTEVAQAVAKGIATGLTP